MAHAVQKVVQRCEDCEENGGSMGKKFIKSENKKIQFPIQLLKLRIINQRDYNTYRSLLDVKLCFIWKILLFKISFLFRKHCDRKIMANMC